MSDKRVGSRGGSTDAGVAEMEKVFEKWRSHEYGGVRAYITLTCAEKGEIHGEDLAGLELRETNIIGAAFNALCSQGLIKAKVCSCCGQDIKRAGSNKASHGRQSGVYLPTEKGKRIARKLWYDRDEERGFWEPGAMLNPIKETLI